MRKLIILALAAAALAVLGSAARADEYPNKPVTLVAVFGPGSASDTICRVIAQPLSLALKESVIVENRPGANGALAAFYVARSAPDGYTLLMGTNSPLSAAPFLMRNLSYDPVKDFEPVSRVGSFTLMLVVNPSLPVKSVKELIDYARLIPASSPSPVPTPRASLRARPWRVGPASTCCTCRTRARRPRSRTCSPGASR